MNEEQQQKASSNIAIKEILLEITNKCPLKCSHCSSNAAIDNNTFIPFDTIKLIISEAKDMGAEVVQLSGGEPILHEKISLIIQYAQKLDLKVELYSCGNDINQNKFEEIKNINKFTLSEKDKIIFSLHGFSRENHEYITNTKSSYNNVRNSIINSLKENIDTEIHVVPNRNNIFELENIVEWAKNIGISRVSFLKFVNHGRGRLNSLLFNIPVEYEYKIFHELYHKYGSYIRLGSPYNYLGIRPLVPCGSGLNKITITPDLELYPCVGLKKFLPSERYIDSLKNIHNKYLLTNCNNCYNKNTERYFCKAQRLGNYNMKCSNIQINNATKSPGEEHVVA